jgi:hypothetical protein
MFRNQRSKVDIPSSVGRLARELFAHVGAHLVTSSANRRTQVYGQLVGSNSKSYECIDARVDDSGNGSPPP